MMSVTATARASSRVCFRPSTGLPRRARFAPRASRRQVSVQSFLDKTKDKRPRDLVVAVDATEASRAGLAWAVSHLYRHGDTLHILHIIPYESPAPSFPGSTVYDPPQSAKAHAKQMKIAKQFVTNVCVKLAEDLGAEHDAVRIELVEEPCDESIGQAIIHHVDNIDADMLVVMAHDKNPVQELLMGSVSKYCIAKAHCPTVLLPEVVSWPDMDAMTDEIAIGLVD